MVKRRPFTKTEGGITRQKQQIGSRPTLTHRRCRLYC